MKNKALTLNHSIATELASFATLLAVAAAAPLLGNQLIVGPLVNAALFMAVALLGVQGAVLIALLPSIIALSIGLLPGIIAPMVPFIMTGNVILVFVFYALQKNYWQAVVTASFLKFLFLYFSSFLVIEMITKEAAARGAAYMMSWPQFFTAIAGGIITAFVLSALRHYTLLEKKSALRKKK